MWENFKENVHCEVWLVLYYLYTYLKWYFVKWDFPVLNERNSNFEYFSR